MVFRSTLILNLIVTLVTLEFKAQFMYHSVMSLFFNAFTLKVTRDALIRNVKNMSCHVMTQNNLSSNIYVTLITCANHTHCANIHATP